MPNPRNEDEMQDDDAGDEEMMPGMRIVEGDEDLELADEEEKPKSALEELDEAEEALDTVPMTFEDEGEEE